MQITFNVGDRVRLIDDVAAGPKRHLDAGLEGTVTAVLPDLPYPVYVDFDGVEEQGLYAHGTSTSPNEIERI